MDPLSLVMLAMIGLLIIFMVRNSRKRREMMQKLQDNMKPGVQVMLQSGIFGVIEEVDGEDENKILIRSGSSTLLVHRNAIGNIVDPVTEEAEAQAPDDDPDFGEHFNQGDNGDLGESDEPKDDQTK